MGIYLIILRLWDNLYDDEILSIINNDKNEEGFINVDKIAKKLAKSAEEKSLDREYESPFVKKAKEFKIFHLKGGKQDDITVIVSQIIEENGSLTNNHSTLEEDGVELNKII